MYSMFSLPCLMKSTLTVITDPYTANSEAQYAANDQDGRHVEQPASGYQESSSHNHHAHLGPPPYTQYDAPGTFNIHHGLSQSWSQASLSYFPAFRDDTAGPQTHNRASIYPYSTNQ